MCILVSILVLLLASCVPTTNLSQTRYLIQPAQARPLGASGLNEGGNNFARDFVTSNSEFDRILLRLQDMAYNGIQTESASQSAESRAHLDETLPANIPVGDATDAPTIPQSDWIRMIYGYFDEIRPTTTTTSTTTIRPAVAMRVPSASGRFSFGDYLPDDMSVDDIMSMIERQDASPAGDESAESECPICLEADVTESVKLDCNHSYHRGCLERWYRESRSYRCPVCRRPMKISGTPYETTLFRNGSLARLPRASASED